MEEQKLIHQDLISMNSDAIGLMLEGRHDDALALFHGALEQAKHAFQFMSKELEMTTFTTTLETCFFEVSLDQVIYPYDCSERASPDNCFRLYRQVFTVAETQGETAAIALGKVLAVVAYNAGLVYHECGLACSDENMISRALCLYNIAASVLGAHHMAGNQDSALMPFEMALYNNLGHIHGVYSDREGAASCLDRVKEIFVQCPTLGDEATAFFRSSCSSHSYLHKAPAA